MKVGVDLIEIERIRKALERPGFRERCFTEAERAYCDSRPDPAQSYAARFAGKEAVGKALGCGIHFTWKEMEIVGRPKPGVQPLGSDRSLRGAGEAGAIDLSMTHSREIAAAIAVVRAARVDAGRVRAALHRCRDARRGGALSELPGLDPRADGARRQGRRARSDASVPGRAPLRLCMRRRVERWRRARRREVSARGGARRRRDERRRRIRRDRRCALRYRVPRRAAAGGGGAHRADERGPRAGRLRRPPLRRRRVDRRDRGRGGRGGAHGDLPRAQGRCRRRAGPVPRRRGRRLRHRPRGRRHGASEGDVRSAGRRPAACPWRYEVQGRRRRRRRRPPGDDGCGMPVRSRGTSSGCRVRHAGCAARVAACDRGHGARAGQGRLERGGRGGGRAAGRRARGGGGDRPRPRTR